jgi:hypothetical protein
MTERKRETLVINTGGTVYLDKDGKPIPEIIEIPKEVKSSTEKKEGK